MTWEGVGRRDIMASRFTVSGSEATIIGVTKFNIHGRATQSWIRGKQIFVPFGNGNHGRLTRIGVWKYPKGGSPTKTIKDFGDYKQFRDLQAVTFSPQ